MRILLDTHVLLWALGAASKLSVAARTAIADRANDVFFSSVSIWEIAIKASRGKQDFKVSPGEILANSLLAGFSELPLRSDAALIVSSMPFHHGDPFDRVLLAQAVTEHVEFYTVDAKLTAYSELVKLI